MHGHRMETRDALHTAGLADVDGNWTGKDARLWFLGDYVDRGPDGVGVIDDVRRLAAQAPATGGEVGALLGNHEAQLLAAWLFGDTPVQGWDQPGGFHGRWSRFGGREDDRRRLADEHVAWIRALPAIAVVDEYLLLHSDTTSYLEFGSTVETVNKTVSHALHSTDRAAWLEFCGRMSSRGSFRDARTAESAESAESADPVAAMLDTFGADMIVHGHSTLISHFAVAPESVRSALRYADGRVIAIDGGVYEGGRVLLTRLK